MLQALEPQGITYRDSMKYIWLSVFGVVLIWSGIGPKDRLTWFLEVLPAVIAVVVLAATYRSFRLTPLLYVLILLHCVILRVGGHYTYAEVPWFDGLFGWERNNYDKLGHFAQGFVPALVAREIIIRNNIVDSRAWTNFFLICTCLAFSAFYELIEWWVAVATEEGSEAFLGTQGYAWDTQSDMGFALLGAVSALVLLSRFHDTQISGLGLKSPITKTGNP